MALAYGTHEKEEKSMPWSLWGNLKGGGQLVGVRLNWRTILKLEVKKKYGKA
jgi:hypothetical protein